MQSQSSSAELPPPAPTLGGGAQVWSQLSAAVRQREELDARIVELTGQLQRSGTIETLEGVPLDTALNLVHRLPASERGMMLTAADVLADMPQTKALFHAGVLSYGQVRGIVAEAKRLSKIDRAVLDGHIGASADDLPKMDPDDAVDAARVVVEELRGIRAAERSEERVERSSFLWAQPAMFGPGKVYGEMDNLSLAMVLERVDAMAPADDGRPLSQRRADGLIALAAHDCDDPTAPARAGAGSTIVVALDQQNVHPAAAGTVEINAPGCLPTITAKAAEALAQDADVQVVLFDGGRPLTVTKKLRANAMPKAVRTAVKVRDRGDRFPGSRRPIEHIHHLAKDDEGHHVDHLLGLSGRSHRRVHRNGWTVTINPGNAEVTFTRGERTWTTLPRGTRLRPPQPPDLHPPAADCGDRGPPEPPADTTLPF